MQAPGSRSGTRGSALSSRLCPRHGPLLLCHAWLPSHPGAAGDLPVGLLIYIPVFGQLQARFEQHRDGVNINTWPNALRRVIGEPDSQN